MGSNFYEPDPILNLCPYNPQMAVCSVDAQKITPVKTFYPPATVCYVDESGGRRLEYLTIIMTII